MAETLATVSSHSDNGSYNATFDHDYAFDNSTSTHWTGPDGIGTALDIYGTAWVRAVLDQARPVTKISLYGGTVNPGHFLVEYSTDDVNWYPVHGARALINTAAWHDILIPTITAQYWRVQQINYAGNRRLWEMDIYYDDAATGGEYTSTPTIHGAGDHRVWPVATMLDKSTPYNAGVDWEHALWEDLHTDNYFTSFNGASDVGEIFLEMDFGEAIPMSKWIWEQSSFGGEFAMKLQYSDDGVSWTDAGSTITAVHSSAVTGTLSSPVWARYWRIENTAYQAAAVRVWHLEFYLDGTEYASGAPSAAVGKGPFGRTVGGGGMLLRTGG